MTDKLPFNPLDRIALADSVVQQLIAQAPEDLPPEPFAGAGIYAIYYQGGLPIYRSIADGDSTHPIYVGKAVPAGARVGGFDLGAGAGKVLFNRLRQHAKSVEEAGFAPEDFKCRYLVVEDIWIPLAEQLMISSYRPLWNHVVFGFGNHDPGKNRGLSARSLWDELHPGRSWAVGLSPAQRTVPEIEDLIAAYLAGADLSTELGEPEED